MAVNFTKYQDDITRAWRDVVDSSNTQKWALFTYEGPTNVIKLMATGLKGLDELVQEFNCSLIQYAFCRVIDESLGLNKLILINWQGDSAPLSRKGLCASHVGDVSNYFKGCAQTITIRNDDEATKEHLMEQILKTSASKFGLSKQQSQQPILATTTTTTTTTTSNNGAHNVQTRNEPNDSNSVDNSVSSSISSASSVYKKVEIGTDIAASRKSFWQRQEEEEKERLAEEKRRAAEKQAQFERERKQREEMEAKKLAETIRERDRLIEATKKADKQATGVASQPVISAGGDNRDSTDDDGRVGRRSELIRLERNQETQSLISKGLIKNKRAIFEQAQQQQQQNQQPTLTRRASGAMIAKRVNAFKSMDCSSSNVGVSSNTNDGSISNTTVNKLTESFSKQVSMNGDESAKASPAATIMSTSTPVSSTLAMTAIKKEIEPVTLTLESDDLPCSNSNNVTTSCNKVESDLDDSTEKMVTSSIPALSTPSQPTENGVKKATEVIQDDNGNIENSFSKKSPIAESPVARSATPTDVITNEELIMNGKSSSIKAIALFDYQAADNTEISFDPEDQIGHIQKVDPGWWHGQVISGKFKGQIGLFPANYVQEI